MAFLPPEAAEVLRREMAQGRAPVTLENCERAVLAKLRTLREEDFLPYDGGGEGLYRRVYRAVRAGTSVGEILALAKTKRYPMARLRRMLLAAWLEVPQPPEEVPYLRLLGAGKDGRPLLRKDRPRGAGAVYARVRVDGFVYAGHAVAPLERVRLGLENNPHFIVR